jgi:HSP90 family molecular chaperone
MVRFLNDQARIDPEKYSKFYSEFGNFLREGACTDLPNQEDIMKLMRYESSTLDKGESCSLEDYVKRMPEDQDKIYYFVGQNRAMAEASPYMEALLQRNTEVLFCYDQFDDVVFSNVQKYKGKELVSVESSKVTANVDEASSFTASADSIAWVKETLGDRVTDVTSSTRLVTHPAIVADKEASGQVRRMMRQLEKVDDTGAVPPQVLEVNFQHPLLLKLEEARAKDPELAALVMEQIYDNALVYAGLMDDPRPMLTRVTKLMEHAFDK